LILDEHDDDMDVDQAQREDGDPSAGEDDGDELAESQQPMEADEAHVSEDENDHKDDDNKTTTTGGGEGQEPEALPNCEENEDEAPMDTLKEEGNWDQHSEPAFGVQSKTGNDSVLGERQDESNADDEWVNKQPQNAGADGEGTSSRGQQSAQGSSLGLESKPVCQMEAQA
jgi:hypothetical protein